MGHQPKSTQIQKILRHSPPRGLFVDVNISEVNLNLTSDLGTDTVPPSTGRTGQGTWDTG